MPPLDETTLVELCLEFLEAAVAEALFCRGLYPAGVFERARLYDIAVRRARYPELRDYIRHAVQGLAVPLRQGTLDKVALVVKSPAGAALERLVMEPRLLHRGPAGGGARGGGGELLELEAQLRAALLKLQYAGAALGPPPPADSAWELVPYVAGREGLAPEDWVEEQPPLEAAGLEMPGSGSGGGAAEIVPLRTCRVEGALALQVYLERPARR